MMIRPPPPNNLGVNIFFDLSTPSLRKVAWGKHGMVSQSGPLKSLPVDRLNGSAYKGKIKFLLLDLLTDGAAVENFVWSYRRNHLHFLH